MSQEDFEAGAPRSAIARLIAAIDADVPIDDVIEDDAEFQVFLRGDLVKALRACAEARPSTEPQRADTPTRGLVIDRDATLRVELRTYLDTLAIDGDNIGEIRRGLFVPWKSAWNGWVREETATRENLAAPPRAEALATPMEKGHWFCTACCHIVTNIGSDTTAQLFHFNPVDSRCGPVVWRAEALAPHPQKDEDKNDDVSR